MLNEFLWPKLNNIDLDDIWFQQDGATLHFANDTINLLREKFSGRVISRNGDVNWPPRSCDLFNTVRLFSLGLREKLSISNPQSIPKLKNEIIGEMEPQLCQHIIENFDKRGHL